MKGLEDFFKRSSEIVRFAGFTGIQIKHIAKIRSTRRNHLFCVKLDTGIRLILKVYHRPRTMRAFTEALALRLTAEKVPSPYVYSCGQFLNGSSYLLITEIQGKRLKSIFDNVLPSDRIEVVRQIGLALANINSIRIANYGSLLSTNGEVMTLNWNQHLFNYISEWVNEIKPNNLDGYLEQALDYIKGHPLANFTPRLLHGDFTLDNILVSRKAGKWYISGIIDFEHSIGGHNEFDFRKLHLEIFKKYPNLQNYFYNSYQNLIPLSSDFENNKHIYQIIEGIAAARYGIKYKDNFHYNGGLYLLKKVLNK